MGKLRQQAGTGPSRRRVIKGLGAAAGLAVAAPMVLGARPARAARPLVLVSYGGTYHAAIASTVVKPFTDATGIPVTIIDTPELAKVRAQVMTGNIEWDVFDAVGSMATAGSKAGYWEPLDPSLVPADELTSAMTRDYVPFYIFAGGVAWDPKRFAEGKHPRDFGDYFDVAKFPGRRTFRNRVSETLEVALLGDGVAPRDLYPLDVERGFKALERIKPHVAKWVEQTPQTITLLQSNETDFTYTYASRVKQNQASGVSVDFSFDQTLNGREYLAVVKGSPNKEAAMRFVAFAMQPKQQAAFMEELGNIPNNKKALELLRPETRRWLPNMDSPRNALIDDAWWTDKYEPLTRRFQEWLLA